MPESDLSNHSVGKGGYPDRDGKVTLDASIMDGDGRCGPWPASSISPTRSGWPAR